MSRSKLCCNQVASTTIVFLIRSPYLRTMPSAEVVGSIVRKRRNGQQQACEPCRKSKLRCDHSTPVCARCKRRRVTSECVYDPSPRKTSGPSKDASPLSTIPKSTPNMNLSLKLQSLDDYQIFATGSPYVEKCPNGFLGPTSYSAIFSEHQGKLGMDLLDPCKSYNQHRATNGLLHPTTSVNATVSTFTSQTKQL